MTPLDSIVYYQSDGQHETEQRKSVDGKAKQRKKDEGPHQRNWYSQERDERCAPSLQEDVHHDDHQDNGDQQGLDDLLNPFCHCARRVERDGVIDALRKSLPLLSEKFFDPVCRLHGIRTRQLVHRDDRTRFAIQLADDRVVLRPHLHAGDVLDPYDPTIGRGADNDLFELLGRSQTTLCPDRVGEFLTLGCRLAADLTGWIHRILRLDRCHDLGYGDRELGQLVRLDPQSHRIPAGPKHLNAANSGNTAQLIVQVDVRVVRQELRVIDTAGRIETDQHQRRSDCLLHRHPKVRDVGRKLRGGLRLPNLGEDQVRISIGSYVVIDDQPHLAGRRVHRVHVVHVVHAAHLLLDRGGDGLFHCLCIGADIGRLHLHFWGSDCRELRDGKAGDRDGADQYRQHRDHDGYDGAVDEEL